MGVKTEKINDELIITIRCKHLIVDDCFLFASMNAPSQGKELIMETAGEAYENYVNSLASESDKEYLNKEFSKVKISII